MPAFLNRVVKVFLALSCSLAMAWPVHAQQAKLPSAWSPTPLETAQIPHYCWGHLNTPYKDKPEFLMWQCGNGVHHYCVARVYLLRAEKPTYEKWIRKDSVTQAKTELDYAMQRLTDQCPVKNDFYAAVAKQEALARALR